MKRLLNFSLVATLAVLVLASCSKNRDYYDNGGEEALVYKHDYSPWVILSFSNGDFAVMKALSTNQDLWPEKNDILRGNFESKGTRTFRNVTANYNFNGLIAEFQDNLTDALDDWDYYATQDGYPPSSAVSRTKDFTPMARSPKTGTIK